MAPPPHRSRVGRADEPPWPAVGDAKDCIVFLIDASSRFERRLLERWIERQRPAGESAPRCRLSPIPPRRPRPAAESPPGCRLIPIPPRRRRRRRGRGRGPGRVLEEMLAGGSDVLLAPLRVAWLPRERDGVRAVRLVDLLAFADPRDPGRLQQRWIAWHRPDRYRIVAGEPARASALRKRWTRAAGDPSGATIGLAEFVVRQAVLTLERAERRIRGARYKVPRLVEQEILSSPAFRGRLARIANELGRSEGGVAREAARDLREIAATHSPLVIDIVARLIHLLYRRGYGERLQYDRSQLDGLSSLAQRHPVVFLPTHKSNLDHLVLQYALHENGLPPNHTAGGINMNFFPVGPLIRRSGTFFIRRSFRDDPVYKHVLRSYIDYLLEKRFSLEWYIEGGRSRSGKLLPPRFGMLRYVVDSYRRGQSDDVHLIPVSIAYDQIHEVGGYAAEQRGGAKEKESFGWFLRMVSALGHRYGRIHIRFGEPLSLRAQLGSAGASDAGVDEQGEAQKLALQKLAFEVAVRINRVTPITPITPISVVTLALLGTGDRAQSVAETRRALVNLLRYIEQRKLPTTAQLFHLESEEGVRQSLEALVENGVATRFDGGLECVYRIGPEEQLTAAYYRNTVIHFFVLPAIIELCLLHVAEAEEEDPLQALWREALRLRDLLKFEFFFSDKETYRQELEEELRFHDANWQQKIRAGSDAALALLRGIRPFSSHRVLRPYLESYRVVSDSLEQLDPAATCDVEALVAHCLGLGEQYQLQRRIQSTASVSKVLFRTALQLAANRGLLSPDTPELAERRREFAHEIRDVNRRIEAMVALASSRRAGLIT